MSFLIKSPVLSVDNVVRTAVVVDQDCNTCVISNEDGVSDIQVYTGLATSAYITVHPGGRLVLDATYGGRFNISRLYQWLSGETVCYLLAPSGTRNVDIWFLT